VSRKIRNGNIFSLESLWASSTEHPRQSVLPILDIIKMAYNTKVSHLSSNTKTEFLYNLGLAGKEYGILYLAFHGQSGRVLLRDGELTLDEIAKAMKQDFKGMGVHFASCNIMGEDDAVISKFIKKTKVSFVSGYTQRVYWIPSAAVDLVYLDYIIDNWYNPELAVEKMKEQIVPSERNLGFKFVVQ
jgi:uncharacterized protein DUF6642